MMTARLLDNFLGAFRQVERIATIYHTQRWRVLSFSQPLEHGNPANTKGWMEQEFAKIHA
jgi:hypothetical protein